MGISGEVREAEGALGSVFEWKLMLWQRGKLPLVSLCARTSCPWSMVSTSRPEAGSAAPSDQGRKHHRQNPLLLLPYNVDPLAAIAKGTYFLYNAMGQLDFPLPDFARFLLVIYSPMALCSHSANID